MRWLNRYTVYYEDKQGIPRSRSNVVAATHDAAKSLVSEEILRKGGGYFRPSLKSILDERRVAKEEVTE